MVRTINLGYGTITRDSPFRSELVKKVKTFKMIWKMYFRHNVGVLSGYWWSAGICQTLSLV